MQRAMTLAVVIAAALLLVLACGRRRETATGTMDDSTAVQTAAARERLQRITEEIDSLTARTLRADARLRAKLGAEIESLRTRRAWIAARLDSLKSAGGTAWSRARAGTDTLLRALEFSVVRLRAKLEGRPDTTSRSAREGAVSGRRRA